MTPKLHIDLETRSELDLKQVGLHNYARHPSTDIWCMAWAIDDTEPLLYTPDVHECPIRDHITSGAAIYAWSAGFEFEIWNEILAKRYGWPTLAPEQMYCTQSQAMAMALPGALDNAAHAIGVKYLKDMEGRALMLRMCRPRSRPGVTPVVWWDEPEKTQRLGEYCQQDVRVERAIGERLMALSDKERRVWLLDQKINRRGVYVDLASAKAAATMAEVVKGECDKALSALTAGAVQTVSAVTALKSWLASQGTVVDSVNKQTIVDMLNEGSDVDVLDDTLSPRVRKALLLRQEAGKASTAKFDVMLRAAGDDSRLRGMYFYHGGFTGRWAGRLVQTHNLPRNMPSASTVEDILAIVRTGDWRAIDMIYGAPLTALSRCLRSFFAAAPGHKLVSGDWSNVEGRGDAWFAGEQWKLAAFRAADEKRGPGIYELAYSRMFNVPVESVKNPSEERQIGKVSELAFARGGAAGSFRTMAKAYPEISGKISDAQADDFKIAWRSVHLMIKSTWRQVHIASVAAVQNPGQIFTCGFPGRQASFRMVGSFLWCLLPSGRAICYPFPKILEDSYGPQLTYMTVPSQEDRKKHKIIDDPVNTNTWARVATFGGAVFGQIVQAFCRDFLADTMLWLDEKGAAIVMHTHDDIVLEVQADKAEGAREAMQERMRVVPEWAAGFPLFAKCIVQDRYGK